MNVYRFFMGCLILLLPLSTWAQTTLRFIEPAVDANPDPDIVEVYLAAVTTEITLVTGSLLKTDIEAFQDVLSTNEATFPGPLIYADVGDRVIVHFTNNMAEELTVHWHGVEVPALMDGTEISQDMVMQGDGFDYDFTLLDGQLAWYHPHHHSRERVNHGMYGAVLAVDTNEDANLNLPTSNIVLVLDDVSLSAINEIVPTVTDRGESYLVNGMLIDTQDVSTIPIVAVTSGAPVRLRLLSTANARFLYLAISNTTMYRIGGDGGLCAEPETIGSTTNLALTPGERADVVFTPIAALSNTVYLETYDEMTGRNPFELVQANTHTKLLGFTIIQTNAGATEFVPTNALRSISLPVNTNQLDVYPVLPVYLQEGTNTGTMAAYMREITFSPNSLTGGTIVSEAPVSFEELTVDDTLDAVVGGTYLWKIVNLMQEAHNFHAHGFFFQHVSTEYVDLDNTSQPYQIEYPVVNEFKDTIIVPAPPGDDMTRTRTIVTLAVEFSDEGREGTVEAFDWPARVPEEDHSSGWMYHCHLLAHADMGMMGVLNMRYPNEFYETPTNLSGFLTFAWYGVTGSTYAIEYSSNLVSWSVAQSNITAATDGDLLSFEDTSPTNSIRLFRLLESTP